MATNPTNKLFGSDVDEINFDTPRDGTESVRKYNEERGIRSTQAWRPSEPQNEFDYTDSDFEMFDDTISGGGNYRMKSDSLSEGTRFAKSIIEENQSFWTKTKENASHVFTRTKELASEAGENATALIKKHPGEALVVGLLIGAAAGYAVTRREKEF
jgi:hypothetical protein